MIGLLAIFESKEALQEAIDLVATAGYREFEILSPFSLEKDQTSKGPGVLAAVTLAAGVTGMSFGFGLQWLAYSWAFPMNVGGRPLFSWPNYLPITIELSILFAACALFLGLLLKIGLPLPYHPVFNAPLFNLSEDRFYLFLSREDPLFGKAKEILPTARFEEVNP
jgi:hypothetical protein